MVKMTVVAGPDTGKVFTPTQETISIGRGEDCEVVLRDGAVSRRHCTIQRSGPPSKVTLSDLYTPNGTFLNEINNRIQRCDLNNGDEIIIGKSWLRVELLEDEQTDQTKANGNTQPPPDDLADALLPKNWQSGMTVVASRASYPLLEAAARRKKGQEQTGFVAGLKRFFRSLFSPTHK